MKFLTPSILARKPLIDVNRLSCKNTTACGIATIISQHCTSAATTKETTHVGAHPRSKTCYRNFFRSAKQSKIFLLQVLHLSANSECFLSSALHHAHWSNCRRCLTSGRPGAGTGIYFIEEFYDFKGCFLTNNLMGTLSTFALANTKWIASNCKISFILRCLESVILSR